MLYAVLVLRSVEELRAAALLHLVLQQPAARLARVVREDEVSTRAADAPLRSSSMAAPRRRLARRFFQKVGVQAHGSVDFDQMRIFLQGKGWGSILRCWRGSRQNGCHRGRRRAF